QAASSMTSVKVPAPPSASVPAAPPAKVPSSPPAAAAEQQAAAKRISMFPGAERASTEITPLGAYEAVAKSARLSDLVAVTQRVVGEAAAARRAAWSALGGVITAADELKLARADA